MSGDPFVLLAALAGGASALAVREAVLAAPRARAWVAEAVRPLGRAGSEGYLPSEQERARLAVVGTALIFGAAVFLTGPGPLTALAFAGPVAAGQVVASRRRRYLRRVERSLPAAAIAMADAVSAGHSPRGALVAASRDLDGPAVVELARVRADLELGAPTREALEGMARRTRSDRMEALVSALVSQHRSGGDLAGLLRRFAAGAAEEDRALDDARSATAQARFTGLLVVAMPAGAALFAELLRPGFVSGVLAEPAGVAMLAAAALLQAAGFAAIRRLGRAEP